MRLLAWHEPSFACFILHELGEMHSLCPHFHVSQNTVSKMQTVIQLSSLKINTSGQELNFSVSEMTGNLDSIYTWSYLVLLSQFVHI